jgi:hypothetical protein
MTLDYGHYPKVLQLVILTRTDGRLGRKDFRMIRSLDRRQVQGEHILDETIINLVQSAERIFPPTTLHRTSTPIRFKHELVVQVYFSIEGETIDGTKITGADQTGELRMLVIPVSVVLPSVNIDTSSNARPII